MRHINESIIGKRGSNNKLYNSRLGLRQGDIVSTRSNPDTPYMYILDEDLIKISIHSYGHDISDGIALRYDHTRIPYFLVMSDYDDNLVSLEQEYDDFSIGSIWRCKNPFVFPNTLNELVELCRKSNLESLIKNHYYNKIK